MGFLVGMLAKGAEYAGKAALKIGTTAVEKDGAKAVEKTGEKAVASSIDKVGGKETKGMYEGAKALAKKGAKKSKNFLGDKFKNAETTLTKHSKELEDKKLGGYLNAHKGDIGKAGVGLAVNTAMMGFATHVGKQEGLATAGGGAAGAGVAGTAGAVPEVIPE
jgi:hypothetical protein